MDSITIYLDSATHYELRAPKNGRGTLEIDNANGAAIYMAEDTMANAENGISIAANTVRKYGKDSEIAAVPQGSVWLTGSQAAPTRQKVIIRCG